MVVPSRPLSQRENPRGVPPMYNSRLSHSSMVVFLLNEQTHSLSNRRQNIARQESKVLQSFLETTWLSLADEIKSLSPRRRQSTCSLRTRLEEMEHQMLSSVGAWPHVLGRAMVLFGSMGRAIWKRGIPMCCTCARKECWTLWIALGREETKCCSRTLYIRRTGTSI